MKVAVLRLIGHEPLALTLDSLQETLRSKGDVLASVSAGHVMTYPKDFYLSTYRHVGDLYVMRPG